MLYITIISQRIVLTMFGEEAAFEDISLPTGNTHTHIHTHIRAHTHTHTHTHTYTHT
jgi:hypothetical protein